MARVSPPLTSPGAGHVPRAHIVPGVARAKTREGSGVHTMIPGPGCCRRILAALTAGAGRLMTGKKTPARQGASEPASS